MLLNFNLSNINAQEVSIRKAYKDSTYIEKRIRTVNKGNEKIEIYNQNNEITVLIIIDSNTTTTTYYKPNNKTDKLTYINDDFGNTKRILTFNHLDSLTSSIEFNLNYKDSLLISKHCISGCDYNEAYYYNTDKKLIKTIQIYPNNKDWNTTSTWGYDKKNRIIEYVVETVNSPRSNQKITTSYKEDVEIKESFIKKNDEWILIERITYLYKDNLLSTMSTEFFENNIVYTHEWKYVYE